MKRWLLAAALMLSMVSAAFAPISSVPEAGAVTCYIDPTAPYNVGTSVRAYADFYCSSGSQIYQTCLWQNNINIRCNSGVFSGGTQWFFVTATCNYRDWIDASFKTTAYIYTTGWVLIKSATSATTYHDRVWDC